MTTAPTKYTDIAIISRAMLFLILLCSISPSFAESQTTVQLPVNVQTAGSMPSQSTVIYEITLPTPGLISISLTGWLNTLNWGLDIDALYIYNSDGIAIKRDAQSTEDKPFIGHMMSEGNAVTAEVGVAGTYFIHLHSGAPYLWPDSVNSQSYTITANFTEVSDIYENNGSMETATTLSLGEEKSAYQWNPVNTSAVYGDEDWYKITLPSPGILTLHYSDWLSTYNWGTDYDRIYMYTSDGTMFDANGGEEYIFHMFGGDDSLNVAISKGGEYYLNLHAGMGAQLTPYTLRASFIQRNDQQEPNDTVEQATEAASGTVYNAYQWKSLEQGPFIYDDEDYYTFQLQETTDVTVSVNGWISTFNWSANYDRLYLFHTDALAEGGVVEDFTQHMFGDAYQHTFSLEPGKYFVRLHSGSGIGSDGYTITIDYSDITVVEENIPSEFTVKQPYPNPFNPATTIQYELANEGSVIITVYNSVGQQVLSFDAGQKEPGKHTFVFNASKLTTGMYFYRLDSGEHSATGKMLYMK